VTERLKVDLLCIGLAILFILHACGDARAQEVHVVEPNADKVIGYSALPEEDGAVVFTFRVYPKVCSADLNNDGQINSVDLGLLLAAMGMP